MNNKSASFMVPKMRYILDLDNLIVIPLLEQMTYHRSYNGYHSCKAVPREDYFEVVMGVNEDESFRNCKRRSKHHGMCQMNKYIQI